MASIYDTHLDGDSAPVIQELQSQNAFSLADCLLVPVIPAKSVHISTLCRFAAINCSKV